MQAYATGGMSLGTESLPDPANILGIFSNVFLLSDTSREISREGQDGPLHRDVDYTWRMRMLDRYQRP